MRAGIERERESERKRVEMPWTRHFPQQPYLGLGESFSK
jgi:hypothetical protein